MKLHAYLGLASVADDESPLASQWARWFDGAMIIVVILLALQWHLTHKNELSLSSDILINASVWAFLVARFCLLAFLVKNRLRYFQQNVMYALIILAGLVLFFRVPAIQSLVETYRIVLAVLLLLPWLDSFYDSLSDNRLGTTVWSVFTTVVLIGVLISDIDPGIHSVKDGIWWAWVTVSTVGYGDVVPTSDIGRVLAAFLIFMGLCFFAILTANFSAVFMQRKVRKVGEKVDREMAIVKQESDDLKAMLAHLQQLQNHDEAILKVLTTIETRLTVLEQRLPRTSS